jgi:protein SCO1/2
MIAVRGLLLAAALVWLAALPAAAHHIAEVAGQIHERDMFFEPVDRTAPGFALETADGRKVGLADFRGKVVVLDFIYARCKEECPLQSDLLATVQQQLNRTPMGDLVEFVSVATDTEDAGETAQIMRGYGARHGFDPANWTFLYRGSGPLDAGIKAAAAYGLKFQITKDGDQMHGIVTHVIDQAGRLRGRFHGLKFDPTDLILFVNALTNEPPGAVREEVAPAPSLARTGSAAASSWFDLSLAAGGIGLAAFAILLIRALKGL